MEAKSGRRRLLSGTVVVVVLAALLVAGWRLRGGDTAERPADAPIEVKTVALKRQDMSTTEALSGTLGYGTARTVTGNRDGTVTWLPKPGSLVRRGEQVLRVDDEPVPLFYGTMPLFRTLSERNTVGRDVRIVADNLRALGYSVGRRPATGEKVARTHPAPKPTTTWITVRKGEDVLTAGLIRAIKRWQGDAGLAVTGRIAVGDVVVLGGAVRVDSVAGQLGAPAGGPLMAVTPTTKVITVPADAGEAGSIERGDRVTVALPGDRTVRGRVTAVGRTLKTGEGQNGDEPPKLTVTVAVDDPKKVARLDSADVEVTFVAETHRDVLVAPVGALLALSEGGYAVQVRGGGLVAVETGMFAKGMVEISGSGLTEDTEVVTTS
ncbi:efflux RND transporter periplasmic adaptor subunit [Actinoplanes sp. NPDC049681]|uniref:efflux RND transporter periplasmic adaptor subunit n=1 Tax=Actinoplanes sp. NPDC049681 TaxID=3363905 RepID=UPI00379426C5